MSNKKFNNNNGDIQIVDIQGAKILDWLIERKKVPVYWKRTNGDLIKLIQDAVTSNPSPLLKDIKIDDIDYFKCLQVFKDFESKPSGNSKTLLGYYQNPNTQKWSDVIKAYHKDQLYIGENCQRFTQSLNYDIPNMKKVIEKTMKSLDESNRKEIDLVKSKENAINLFKKACNDIGIKGEKIRDEIMELPKGLDQLFQNTTDILKGNQIPIMIQFYKQFAINTKCELKDDNNLFSSLVFINQHGNISIGEREMILNPSIIVKSNNNIPSTSNGSNIDWDNIKVEDSGSLSEEKSTTNIVTSPSQINWDEFEVVMDDPTDSKMIDEMMENIEIIDESNCVPTTFVTDNNNSNIKILENANESILSDRVFRNKLLDDLYELDMFFKQRSAEMNQPENEFSASYLMKESITLDQCDQYSQIIGTVISQLSATKLKNILELKSSSKLVDRMELQFKQKQNTISKYQQLMIELLSKRQELSYTLEETKRKLDSQIKETKQLRLKLQELLADLMETKQVNIMMPYVL